MFTPTRQFQDQVPSTRDLVLSDDEHSVSKLVVTDSLNHFMVEFKYCITLNSGPVSSDFSPRPQNEKIHMLLIICDASGEF